MTPLLLVRKPVPSVARHQFVCQTVVAYLATVAHLDKVAEILRDILGIRLWVERVRQGGHRAWHGIERRPRTTEREVIVVRKRVKLFPRRVREARVDPRKTWRELMERLQNALVTEVLRHDAQKVRFRVLETEPVEQPAEIGFRDRDVCS